MEEFNFPSSVPHHDLEAQAQLGVPEALTELSWRYSVGYVCDGNLKSETSTSILKGVEELSLAAAKGLDMAAFLLSECYGTGRHLSEDPKLALHWARVAVKLKRSDRNLVSLGKCYLEMEDDYAAIRCFEDAEALCPGAGASGIEAAKGYLAKAGTPHNAEQFRAAFSKGVLAAVGLNWASDFSAIEALAMEGSVRARELLVTMLDLGWGHPMDLKRADRLREAWGLPGGDLTS